MLLEWNQDISQDVRKDLPAMEPDTLLHLVDVGGAGGLEPGWLPYADRIRATLFEPNPEAAAGLRQQGYHTVEAALSSTEGERTLYVTRNPLCISLQKPNLDFCARYDMAEHFEVVKEVPISCTRFDTLCQSGVVGLPDVVKVDTQGHEFEVLLGFGSVLSSCLGIVLETHLYPMYHGEVVLSEIVKLLEPFGLVLRSLEKNTMNWDGDFVEANAYFTIHRGKAGLLSDEQARKFALLCEIWNLPPYRP